MADAVVSAGASANLMAASATERVTPTRQSKVWLLSSNPIKETIKLSIELDRKQKVIISIADIQGRILYRRAALYTQGIQEIMFTPGRLPAGSYMLKVSGDSFTETKKITRQ
jgi:hypothetical protein